MRCFSHTKTSELILLFRYQMMLKGSWLITRHLFSKIRGKPNRNNGLGFRNRVKCIPCFTIFHHFLCISVLLSGDRVSNFALSRIKNPGCVAEFWAMFNPAIISSISSILFHLYGVGLGYYSNMATGSVTIPTRQRARLLFQHGVGLDRTLSFVPTNYEPRLHVSEWVIHLHIWGARKTLVSTLRVATSLKTIPIKWQNGSYSRQKSSVTSVNIFSAKTVQM